MEITLNGTVMIGQVVCVEDGRHGILLKQTGVIREVNSRDRDWTLGKCGLVCERDIVIWLGSLESARVLQDAVNIATLELNGYVVSDTPDNTEVA